MAHYFCSCIILLFPQTATFQTVIVSDGINTFTLIVYKYGEMNLNTDATTGDSYNGWRAVASDISAATSTNGTYV